VGITTLLFVMLISVPARSYSSITDVGSKLLHPLLSTAHQDTTSRTNNDSFTRNIDSIQNDTINQNSLLRAVYKLETARINSQIDSIKGTRIQIDSLNEADTAHILRTEQQIDSLRRAIAQIDSLNALLPNPLSENIILPDDSPAIIESTSSENNILSYDSPEVMERASEIFSLPEPPDSISGKELKQWYKAQQYEQKRLLRIERDSINAIKRSARWAESRILETYALPDSLWFKRIVVWNHEQNLNNITVVNPDTTYNDNYNDYPFMRKDVGATYLGISGSATQLHNYFKRERLDIFPYFEPYLIYSNTPENVSFYNVKTPHTELAYWGTLFANRSKEETNIRFMHTQNFTPQLNLKVSYQRFGAKGLLSRENTDNRTFTLTSNYLGKRYVMHAGYIFQGIKRQENGGLVNDQIVLVDSLANNGEFDDSKTLGITLHNAESRLKRNTLFLTHTYGIPIRFSKRSYPDIESTETQSEDRLETKRDSSVVGDGTITYFGHSFEFSTYHRRYQDEMPSDSLGRARLRTYYNDIFLMGDNSYDSVRVNNLENKLFIRLQPWAQDAIISKLDGGIGHQLLGIYRFRPDLYIKDIENEKHSNIYTYFGAAGNFRQYFRWNATARYDLVGYYANNFRFDGQVGLSLFPVKEGVHVTGRLSIEDRKPVWFNNYYYSNHFHWVNDFKNITETRIEGQLDIPHIKTSLFVGNTLINNHIYYGLQSNIAQHGDIINIFSAYLRKDLRLGPFHMHNRILFQKSSNEEILPLPTLSTNLRYFFEFYLVKNVLRMQAGADITFNTKYYAHSYNAALGVFHTQKDRLIGDYPYIDIFANFQWKRASLFLKYINAAQGWPTNDYFSANRYIRPQREFKFGIFWPFYVD